ncbi:MAG: N-acetylneuraminate synthase family protein [Eubacterium sp.]
MLSSFAQKAVLSEGKRPERRQSRSFQMLQKLALTQENFIELQAYCKTVGIGFLSTPLDLDSIRILEKLDIQFWKLPSGEITNPLGIWKQSAAQEGDIAMSTGMCNMQEIQDAISILEKSGAGKIIVLHCNTEYPTPYTDVNLLAMQQMRQMLQKPVWILRSCCLALERPIAAVSLGATVIEKHFTLDKQMEGPDHRASLEPQELARMVAAIRHIEQSLGDGRKRRTASEEKNCAVARKSIVAKCAIAKGDYFTEENLTVKRPGTGISPMKWYEVLGMQATRDYEADELI